MAEKKTKADEPKVTKAKAVSKSKTSKAETKPAAEKKSKAAAAQLSAAPDSESLPPDLQAADCGVIPPTPEEHYRMVQTAAYFIAERNGFEGNSAEDWAQAELEVADALRA